MSVDPAASGFNPYNYANNNPYRFTDPDGRMAVEEKPKEEKPKRKDERDRRSVCDMHPSANCGSTPSNGGGSGSRQSNEETSDNSTQGQSSNEPLFCAGGADCDFMYNQREFLEGRLTNDEFSGRTVAQGEGGVVGGIVGGAAWIGGPALATGVGRFLGPSGRLLGHPAYGGRTLNFLKSGKFRFGWGRDGGPVLRMGIKNKHIDFVRKKVPTP